MLQRVPQRRVLPQIKYVSIEGALWPSLLPV